MIDKKKAQEQANKYIKAQKEKGRKAEKPEVYPYKIGGKATGKKKK